jgi:Intracellular proteinase inhibitor
LRQPELNFKAVTGRLSVLLALVAAVSLLLLAGCGSGSSSSPTPAAQGSATPVSSAGSGSPAATSSGGVSNPNCTPAQLGLISALTFDKDSGVYDSGTPVVATLVLSNCATNDEKLVYPTTQRYVFIVTDSGGNDMWRSTDGKTFAQTESTETIASQQSVEYTETWNQKDRNGSQVPDGQYKVSAFSVGCIATARSGCEFGPIRFVQVGPVAPSPAVTTAGPATSG